MLQESQTCRSRLSPDGIRVLVLLPQSEQYIKVLSLVGISGNDVSLTHYHRRGGRVAFVRELACELSRLLALAVISALARTEAHRFSAAQVRRTYCHKHGGPETVILLWEGPNWVLV